MLLVVGFGVARFMGKPAYVPDLNSSVAAAAAKNSSDVAPTPLVPAEARLVPDYAANNPYKASNAVGETTSALNSSIAETFTVPTSAAVETASDETFPLRPAGPAPVIKLRDEAPRPLEIDNRAASMVYAPPVLPQPDAAPPAAAQDRTASTNWAAGGLRPAGFSDEAPTNVATINAAYAQPAEISAPAKSVLPPPWPAIEEVNGQRTHIVKDGDSLPRLADLYLDDPARAREIYDANRELLADPELLPIGAELVIPNRKSRAAFDASQSSLAHDSPALAATNRSLVPLRPIPPASTVVPRAQLLPPVAAE